MNRKKREREKERRNARKSESVKEKKRERERNGMRGKMLKISNVLRILDAKKKINNNFISSKSMQCLM